MLDLAKWKWSSFRRMVLHRFDSDHSFMVIAACRNDDQIPCLVLVICQIAVFPPAILKNHVAENQITDSTTCLPVNTLVKDLTNAVKGKKLHKMIYELGPVLRQTVLIKRSADLSGAVFLRRKENLVRFCLMRILVHVRQISLHVRKTPGTRAAS